jgi:hypothetical protein
MAKNPTGVRKILRSRGAAFINTFQRGDVRHLCGGNRFSGFPHFGHEMVAPKTPKAVGFSSRCRAMACDSCLQKARFSGKNN